MNTLVTVVVHRIDGNVFRADHRQSIDRVVEIVQRVNQIPIETSLDLRIGRDVSTGVLRGIERETGILLEIVDGCPQVVYLMLILLEEILFLLVVVAEVEIADEQEISRVHALEETFERLATLLIGITRTIAVQMKVDEIDARLRIQAESGDDQFFRGWLRLFGLNKWTDGERSWPETLREHHLPVG